MSRQLEIRGTARGPAANANAYDFLNTHPSTPERIQRAVEVAREFTSAGSTGERDRVSYLSAIDGMAYGDDPGQGFVRGQTFLHPRLGFTFNAPPNFSIDNTPQAILGLDGNGRALRLDTVKLKDGQSLDTYLSSGWIDGVDTGSVSNVTINGNQAVTGIARGDEWSFRLYAIKFGSDVYRLILAARDFTPATDAAFQQTASSFRRLSAEELRNVRPMRIDIATVRSGDTLQSLAGRMALADDKLERFLILNGFDANNAPRPGDRVKIIVE
jgi:predicted Zn-dependent protease